MLFWAFLLAFSGAALGCERSYAGCLKNGTVFDCTNMDFGKIPCATQNSSVNFITSLDLSDNRITSILRFGFSLLTSLQSLKIRNNQLSILFRSSLRSLTSLVSLDLSNNQLTQIRAGTFSTLTKLQNIDFSFNRLTLFSSNALIGTTTVQHIDLSDNNIALVGSGSFLRQSSIKSIDLSNNAIPRVLINSFSDMPMLEQLDLSNNRVTLVTTYAFMNMSSLVTLNLSNNVLTRAVDRSFSSTPRLQTLDMSNNRIKLLISIPGSTAQSHLTFINLANNSITSFKKNSFFQGFSGLRTIYLQDNFISSIDNTLFDNSTALETLLLQNNNLTDIEAGSFANQKNLTTLGLYPNPLDCCLAEWVASLASSSLLCSTYSLDGVATPSPHCARCGFPAALQGVAVKDSTPTVACAAIQCPVERPQPPPHAINDPNCPERGYGANCSIFCASGFSPSTKQPAVWVCSSKGSWVTTMLCDDLIMKYIGTTSRILNRAYAVSRLTATWSASQANCTQRGGKLVTFASVFEARYVSAFFERSRLVNGVWIGLTFNATLNQPVWTDGRPITYAPSSFDAQTLNDASSCTAMTSRNRAQTWSAIDCSTFRKFMCEYPANDLRLATN